MMKPTQLKLNLGAIQTWCRRHLFNVVPQIDFGLLAIKQVDDMPTYDQEKLLNEYDECLNSRIFYE